MLQVMQTSPEFLEIHTFGHVNVVDQTTRLTLSLSPREEALLIYLAYHTIPITRVQLCQIFWPDDTNKRARGNLRKLLTDIRKSLGSFVITDRESVWLIDGRYWLDVHDFQRHMYPIYTQQETPQTIAESDIVHLTKAIQLYHGDFLAHFKQPQSHRFGKWIEEKQSGLHEQAIFALRLLVSNQLQGNQFTQAILNTKRLLSFDPLDEDSNAQLMRLLASQNQTAAALEHYHQYAQLLEREVGSVVESDLTKLYQQIKAGMTPSLKPSPSYISDQTVQNRARKPIAIPQPLTPLIGRAVVLNQLCQYVQSSTVRLITLTGLGGVGKSRVAVALSEQVKSLFTDGIVYVGLDTFNPQSIPKDRKPMSATGLLHATARALRLQYDPEDTEEQLLDLLTGHMRNRNRLLIFDGFDGYIEQAFYLIQFLQSAPLSKILVTSREVLQLPGELVVQIEGLGFAEGMDFQYPAELLDAEESGHHTGQSVELSTGNHKLRSENKGATTTASSDGQVKENFRTAVEKQHELQQLFAGAHEFDLRNAPCIRLFTSSAERQNPELTFTSSCIRQIAQICYLLEGNPLAIELAAGLINHYQYAELIAMLQENPQILDTLSRGRAQKQHSMQSVLEESWHTLSPVEQRALIGLSSLSTAFSRDHALQVENTSPAVLIGLAQKSLIRTIGPGRYRLPHIVQIFAEQKRHQANLSARSVQA